ncbi:MAG: hypothetical protein V1736_07355 [Pseudomonadota bacterium]
MPSKPNPADARDFKYGEGKWWGAYVQSYASLKANLRGEGLQQHHLIPDPDKPEIRNSKPEIRNKFE